MKTPDEHLISAYLDGELSEEGMLQFEELLAREPGLKEELDAMRSLSGAIQQHVRFEREMPHADFFSSQLMQQIEREEVAQQKAKQATVKTPWWSAFSFKMLAGAAAACVAMVAAWNTWSGPSGAATQILASYAPDDSIHVQIIHHAEAQASVVMLTGLDAIPDNYEVVGVTITRSEQDAEYAQTTLFDPQGNLRWVMSKDSGNVPVMFEVKG